MKKILPIILLSLFLASCIVVKYGTLNITYEKCDGTVKESQLGWIPDYAIPYIDYENRLLVNSGIIANDICIIKKVEFIPNTK